MIKQQRVENGYDLEELYFERLNRELIQNLKGPQGVPKTENEPQAKSQGAQVLQFPQKAAAEPKKKAA